MTDKITSTLMPGGAPSSADRRAEFFELYKIMVASSEALVGRRQGVNTFFLTMNGLLLTTVGLLLRGGAQDVRFEAAAIVVVAVAGVVLCFAWRSLLISFGQLNTGKFKIINRMEAELAAAIFEAEWEALERGENPRVYRSFTSREIVVPVALFLLYGLTALLGGAVAAGWWDPTS
jgi:hypothetical protein